jgi:hypothetical protein
LTTAYGDDTLLVEARTYRADDKEGFVFQTVSTIDGEYEDSVSFLKIGFGPLVLGAGIGVTEAPGVSRRLGKATFAFPDADSIDEFIEHLVELRDTAFPTD